MRRVLETPFNENTRYFGVSGEMVQFDKPLLACAAEGETPFGPGWRNEYHAGLQQTVGKYCSVLGRIHLEIHPQRTL